MREGAFRGLLQGKNHLNSAINCMHILTRCKSQIEAYDAIEGKIKEFGGHIGYFNVTRFGFGFGFGFY